eukprot:403358328
MEAKDDVQQLDNEDMIMVTDSEELSSISCSQQEGIEQTSLQQLENQANNLPQQDKITCKIRTISADSQNLAQSIIQGIHGELKESLNQVETYLKNLTQFWPYEVCGFNEQIGLDYLALKNNDFFLALTSILFNVNEFHQFVKLIDFIKQKSIQRLNNQRDQTIEQAVFQNLNQKNVNSKQKNDSQFQLDGEIAAQPKSRIRKQNSRYINNNYQQEHI